MSNVLRALKAAVTKDVKRLLSSQFNAGLLLIGPLLLIGLIGFAFQSDTLNDITIGVHSADNNVQEQISSLIDDKDYTAKAYNDTERCKADNKDGKTAACLIFNDGSQAVNVDVYLDFSRSQFAAAVLSQVNKIFDEYRAQKLSAYAEELDQGATNLDDQLSTFQTRLGDLQRSLKTTKERVSNATNEDLDIANKTLGDIPELRERFTAFNQQIKETATYLNETEERLDVNDRRVNEQRSLANSLLEQRGCQGSHPTITGKSTAEIQAILSEANDSTCVFVYSYYEYFDAQAEALNDAQDGIDTQQERIATYQAQLRQADDQPVSSLLGDEIQRVQDRQRRVANNLTDGLTSIASSINTSTGDLAAVQNASFIDSLQNAETGLNPVDVSVNRYESLSSVTLLDVLFPGILTTLASFVGILVGSVLIMKERTSNAGFRNAISPVQTPLLQLATTITGSLISALQVLVVFIIGLLAFGLNASFTVSLLPTLLILGIVFTVIGQVIGAYSPNQEVGTLLSIITAVLLLIFSSVITPLAQMTPFLANIFYYSPFNQAMTLLRRQLIYGESLFASPTSLITLIAWCVVGITVLLLVNDDAYNYVKRRINALINA